jgi:hypothetical protein
VKTLTKIIITCLVSQTACIKNFKSNSTHAVIEINFDKIQNNIKVTEKVLKKIYSNTWFEQDPSLKDHFIPFIRNLNKGPDSTLFVFDFMNKRLVQLSYEGKYIRSIGGPGSGPGEFFDTSEHTFQTNQYLYIADNSGLRLQLFDRNGHYVRGINNASADGGCFAVADDGQIITKPNSMDDPGMNYMLQIQDSLGNEITKIAAIPKDDDFVLKKIRASFIDREPFWIAAKPGHEFIYCIFMYYPEIWIYDYNGLLIEKIHFASEAIHKILKESKIFRKERHANFGGIQLFRDPNILQNGDLLLTLFTQGNIQISRKADRTIIISKYHPSLADSLDKTTKNIQYVQMKSIDHIFFAYDINSIFIEERRP